MLVAIGIDFRSAEPVEFATMSTVTVMSLSRAQTAVPLDARESAVDRGSCRGKMRHSFLLFQKGEQGEEREKKE